MCSNRNTWTGQSPGRLQHEQPPCEPFFGISRPYRAAQRASNVVAGHFSSSVAPLRLQFFSRAPPRTPVRSPLCFSALLRSPVCPRGDLCWGLVPVLLSNEL
ncbi:hypothetical protein Y032_0491g2409 [Ancylostoma ceylanicum]|uniref:Uncharacterized protein n=1 Tax=Ancylostoma ceylanicum TaxID=53326 RepID=A0A016WUS6_9BILA|nr:hypothetical protein Y032_0491g2409 [Ancylostoma ceylanicum]